MTLNSYLSFNGQCEEAFKFYEQCLGGKNLGLIRNGDTPMAGQTPPEFRNRIMHAHMTVGDQVLMGGDAPPGQFTKPDGFCVNIGVTEAAEAERVFQQMSAGGQVQMPMQETFWAVRFGMFIDRFGIPWMVNCPKQQ